MYKKTGYTKNLINLKFRLAIRNEKIKKTPEQNFIYATLSGKHHTNTGIKITTDEWDEKRQIVLGTILYTFEYNWKLKELRKYVDLYNFYSIKFNKLINIEQFSSAIKNQINIDFHEFMIDLNDSQEKRVQDNYNRIIDDFCNFNDNIYFLSLDNCLLDRYDDYLIKRGLKHKTRQQYFNVLYTILDKMVLDNLLFPNHSNRYRALLIPNQ